MATLVTAAGLFSLLTGVLEAVRVYAIDPGDPGLARLGLAAMIIGGLSTAAIGLGVLIGRGGLSVPGTVVVVAGWLIIWFPVTIALGIVTDRHLGSQLAATALCALGIFLAVAAFARSKRGVIGATKATE